MEDRRGDEGIRPRLGILLAIIAATAAITRAAEERLEIPGLREPVEIVCAIGGGSPTSTPGASTTSSWRRDTTPPATGSSSWSSGGDGRPGRWRRSRGPGRWPATSARACCGSAATWRRSWTITIPAAPRSSGRSCGGSTPTSSGPSASRRGCRSSSASWASSRGGGRPRSWSRGTTGCIATSPRRWSTPSSSTCWAPARAGSCSNLHPGQPDARARPALDLSIISDALLETYRASRAPGPVPARGRRARVPRRGVAQGPRPPGDRRRRRRSIRLRASAGRRSRRAGEQQLGDRRRADVLRRRGHGQRPAPEPAVAVAPLLGPPRPRPAGTSSAPASRPCPASRSAITSTVPGDSRSSRSTRKTSTSTRPTPRTRRDTDIAAAGSRCGRSGRRSR